MIKTFHINKRGVPEVCKAKKDKCYIGSKNAHFKSWAEAWMWIDRNATTICESPKEIQHLRENEFLTDSKIIITKEERNYVNKRLEELKLEDKSNDKYIVRCKSSRRIHNFKANEEKTKHFLNDRGERETVILENLGNASLVGIFEVKHIESHYISKQAVEIFSNGKINVYDLSSKKIITTFLAHSKRIEVVLLKAGEIPHPEFLKKCMENREYIESIEINARVD